MRLNRPISLRRFLISMGLVMVGIFAVAAALPHDPYIRYQALSDSIFAHSRWIYERIHFDQTPLDVVFLGPSRTEKAIDSPALEAALRARGLERRVANFALPASGFDLTYALARETLENRKVGLLVVSLVEQFPRDGHQAFGDLATATEILGSPLLVNRNFPRNLAYLPVRQVKLALKTLVPDAFNHRREFDPAAYAVSSASVPTIAERMAGEKVKSAAAIRELKAESDFRRRTLTQPVLPESLGWVEFGLARYYVEAIVELAAEHDTKVVFLYLPFYEGFAEPAELEWVRQFGPVLSASFMISSADNFTDVAHASGRGAKLITDWIADQLVPLLKDVPEERQP